MTALATNNPRRFITKTKVDPAYKQTAAVKIYNGAFLTQASGAVTNLTAGDAFVGIADAGQDNTNSLYSTIPIVLEGIIEGVKVTGASSASNIGSAVYASDNNTLTLTSTGNSAIGGEILGYDALTATFKVGFKCSIIG